MIWPARAVQAHAGDHGHNIILETEPDLIQATIRGDTVLDVQYPPCDVLVMQRTTHAYLAAAVPLIRSKGTAVVVDMDDDLSCIYPENPAFAAFHPRNLRDPNIPSGKRHSWISAEQACRDATLVSVSTPALLRRYGTRGNGRVVKNCLPESVFSIKHEDNDVIGYAGAIHSHANDIPMLGSSIARLMSDPHDPREFMTIADTRGITRALHLPRDPDRDVGPVDVYDWWGAIAEIGVGVAPLADTQFNAGKSWLKPLEMAAVGVPSVVSPRAEYRAINAMGVGILAKNPKEFYAHLKRLTRDSVERQELAEKSYQAVRHLTFEQQWRQWLQIWEDAYTIQNA
jgi:hypothetical protein